MGTDRVDDKACSDNVIEKIVYSFLLVKKKKKGDSGLTVKNGKIYFGAIDEQLVPVDDALIECATDGTTLGEFLNATIKNFN